MRVAWLSTWNRVCGIADYSKAIWPAVQSSVAAAGGLGQMVSIDEFGLGRSLVRALREFAPDVLHIQHEYGIFGGKNPPFYQFPGLVKELRMALPTTRIIATGHTVLPAKYRFPVGGRGWQTPLRALANFTVLPFLRHGWTSGTWGSLDGVIVHSRYQEGDVREAGAPKVKCIPHFVFSTAVTGTVQREARLPPVPAEWKELSDGKKNVVVFGFFTPEKGQDLAIQACREMGDHVRLVLAGGIRRRQDRKYYDQCVKLAHELGVRDRVLFTGYVENQYVDGLYARAQLVLAPFRETSGSGSLAQALSRGAPILASDLVLNREVAERVLGAMEYFKSGDASDCAAQVNRLLQLEGALASLREAALRYARGNSPRSIADQHVAFYRDVLGIRESD